MKKSMCTHKTSLEYEQLLGTRSSANNTLVLWKSDFEKKIECCASAKKCGTTQEGPKRGDMVPK